MCTWSLSLLVVFSILFVSLMVSSSQEESTQTSTDNLKDYKDKTFLSRLYRLKELQSPLYRFKVIDGHGSSPKSQSRNVQDFETLRNNCLENGELFEDPTFEAVDSSLYYSEKKADDYYRIVWLRPHNMVKKPKFIVNGTSRFDVVQGQEGNCWFMAVAANLASNDVIFSQIVPMNQDFGEKYCGIFHFRFWQMGHWVDVVVDDRLPTKDGALYYTRSSDPDEFWGPLLEKAYAKLYGSYEALDIGFEFEAMEDLTGGVVFQIAVGDLLPAPDLFTILRKCLSKQSIITGSTVKDPHGEKLLRKKGLLNNHAYSITDAKYVHISTPKRKEQVPLVRVRNPWGHAEWRGSWSDNAREWNFVSQKEKDEMGLSAKDDGEYWMTYEDFVTSFDEISICLINPNIFLKNINDSKTRWEVNEFKGEWIRGVSAGGSSVDTLHENPQYQITIEKQDNNGEENVANVFIALMQESQRALRSIIKGEEQYLRIGYVIYKLENSTSLPKTLNEKYIRKNRWFETSETYANYREVTRRFQLPPGTYVIIPCTKNRGEEGEFLLRVVTEKKNNLLRSI